MKQLYLLQLYHPTVDIVYVQVQFLVGLGGRKTTNMANAARCYIQSCEIARNGWIYNPLVIRAADALIKKSSRLI